MSSATILTFIRCDYGRAKSLLGVRRAQELTKSSSLESRTPVLVRVSSLAAVGIATKTQTKGACRTLHTNSIALHQARAVGSGSIKRNVNSMVQVTFVLTLFQ